MLFSGRRGALAVFQFRAQFDPAYLVDGWRVDWSGQSDVSIR